MLPLSTTEMAILMNLGSNISKAIEFKDNTGKEREYPLHQLIRYAKASYFELAMFVTEIGKKYSLDIPMRHQQTTFEIPTAPDLIGMESGVVQPLPTVVQPSIPPGIPDSAGEPADSGETDGLEEVGLESFDADIGFHNQPKKRKKR